MEAHFSSSAGGGRLRERVLRVLDAAAAHARSRWVEIDVMTFSFTDEDIAARLVGLAREHSNLSVRVIADWSQGAEGAGRQVRRLAEHLSVRYKNDQPYEWDPVGERLRWSYRASRGLLHHKTLGVFVDGEPTALVCGSFNWTGKAAAGYENLLVLTDRHPSSVALMHAVADEFEAMWSDGRATLSPEEARAHYHAILAEYRAAPATPPSAVTGIGRGEDVPPTERADGSPRADALIAFTSRSPHQERAEAGYSPRNRDRRFELRKPSGRTKRVPLTISTLALDTIARAQPGDRLLVAMYGMSPRVPEYGALLEAARRGVRLQVLLDGRVGRSTLYSLAIAARRERLPIALRAGSRTMHQKYVLHPETDTVLTGTANLSTDATARHTEHRIVLRDEPALARRFLDDFDAIWSRLPPPFRSAPATLDVGPALR